jgi:hypothetical protein
MAATLLYRGVFSYIDIFGSDGLRFYQTKQLVCAIAAVFNELVPDKNAGCRKLNSKSNRKDRER